jgi:hypothetical protein
MLTARGVRAAPLALGAKANVWTDKEARVVTVKLVRRILAMDSNTIYLRRGIDKDIRYRMLESFAVTFLLLVTGCLVAGCQVGDDVKRMMCSSRAKYPKLTR